MRPSLGRIVHYTNLGDADGRYPPEQQAAIVTGCRHSKPVAAGCPDGEFCNLEDHHVVDLHIFYRTGDFFMQEVPFSSTYERGRWTWPPRV